jgi:adenosylcobinamide kinase/adenosylcobinamide-phosphate guanylyltransferase
MYGKVTLILGGARSGKSDYAQKLAKKKGKRVLFVATAQALDDEMKARIAAHRKARPAGWQTLEMTSGIGRHLGRMKDTGDVVVIDCLTLLLSNLMGERGSPSMTERRITREINELERAVRGSGADFVIVSNEVGLGLVPDNPAGRQYRDLLGKVNQAVAGWADKVIWMVAGLPVKVK